MVEADVSGIRKMLDDTNLVCLHLESDVESRAEEHAKLMKDHKAVRNIFSRDLQWNNILKNV